MISPPLIITKDGIVKLFLNNLKPRNLGQIVDNTFHCERNPEKHFMRVNQSYGFNHHLIRTGNFRFVIVRLPDGSALETTREYLLSHGSFLHFQKQDFERQIFLRLRDFGMERALEWERIQSQSEKRKSIQPEQFAFAL